MDDHHTLAGQRRAGLIAVAGLAVLGLLTVRPFLPALGWGVIIAVSLWPWYQRRAAAWPGGRRAALPALVTLAVAVALVLPLALVVRTLVEEVANAGRLIADASVNGFAPPPVLARLPMGARLVGWWQANLAQPGALGAFARGRAPGAMRLVGGGKLAGAVVHRTLIAGLTLLVLFFTLRDGETIAAALRRASARAFGPVGERVGEQMVTAVRGTVNGLVIVGLGEGGLLGLAYAVAGVPHVLLFALFTALLSAVPMGSVVAFVAAAAMLAAAGAYGAAVAVAVVGAVVVFVADHFVRPVLIGGATRLPFVWVLFGILGGIVAWGLVGLVLGPALIAALMLLWREFVGAAAGPLNSGDDG